MGSTFLSLVYSRSSLLIKIGFFFPQKMRMILLGLFIVIINCHGFQAKKDVPREISKNEQGGERYCRCNDQINFPQLCYCDDLGYQVCCPAYTYCCNGGSRCCVKKGNPLANIFPSSKNMP